MKSITLMNSLLTKLILQENQSWSKFLASNLYSDGHISLNTPWIAANEVPKFKLDCVEHKNSYILSIIESFCRPHVAFHLVFKCEEIIFDKVHAHLYN